MSGSGTVKFSSHVGNNHSPAPVGRLVGEISFYGAGCFYSDYGMVVESSFSGVCKKANDAKIAVPLPDGNAFSMVWACRF